jgi:WD domain, G-beta repeat
MVIQNEKLITKSMGRVGFICDRSCPSPQVPKSPTGASTLSIEINTVERAIELWAALLGACLYRDRIHGQITPDRVLIIAENPVRVNILPPDGLGADPEFSAPEVIGGKVSNNSDVYSTGLIIVYLLTGVRPFTLFDTANRGWVWQNYWQQSPLMSERDRLKLAHILDRAIDLNPDLRYGSVAETIAVLRDSYVLAPNWDCVHNLSGHRGLFAAIRTITIDSDRSTIATGSEDKTIRLWEIDTGKHLGILTGHQQAVDAISFHPDRPNLLFSSGKDGLIKSWQVDKEKELISIDSHQRKVTSIAISNDGKLLASGSSDRTIKIWNLDLDGNISIDPVMTLKTHRLAVNQIAFNPDLNNDVKLASVSTDRTVMLWGLNTDGPLALLSDHTQAVKTLAFSPDGKLLATAGDDGWIQIWDVAARTLARTISAHRWTISGLKFWRNGRVLISTSWDGNIKFWHVDSGQEIDRLHTHDGEIFTLAVSKDERSIVTAHNTGACAKIWQLR